MIRLPYEQLQALARNQLCGEHKSELTVVWLPEGFYTLKCHAGDHYPDVLVRRMSLTELWKSGDLPPGPIVDNITRRERQKAMAESKVTQDNELSLIRQRDLGTDQQLSPDQVKALVEYAYKYGLDPYRGHVVLMYGQPYIGLDGYLFWGHKHKIPFQLFSWPMTDKEREQYRIGEYDHGWIAQVVREDTGQTFTGIGIVTQEEIMEEAHGKPGVKRYPVVASTPQQMAQKRAEWQALRRAFPIGETQEEPGEARDSGTLSG